MWRTTWTLCETMSYDKRDWSVIIPGKPFGPGRPVQPSDPGPPGRPMGPGDPGKPVKPWNPGPPGPPGNPGPPIRAHTATHTLHSLLTVTNDYRSAVIRIFVPHSSQQSQFSVPFPTITILVPISVEFSNQIPFLPVKVPECRNSDDNGTRHAEMAC